MAEVPFYVHCSKQLHCRNHPYLLYTSPLRMADSSGKKPTSFPRTDAVNVMIPTMSTTVIRYNGVRVFKIVFRSIRVKPIPASAAAVQLLMANCPHSLAASSSSSDMMPVPFTSTTANDHPRIRRDHRNKPVQDRAKLIKGERNDHPGT